MASKTTEHAKSRGIPKEKEEEGKPSEKSTRQEKADQLEEKEEGKPPKKSTRRKKSEQLEEKEEEKKKPPEKLNRKEKAEQSKEEEKEGKPPEKLTRKEKEEQLKEEEEEEGKPPGISMSQAKQEQLKEDRKEAVEELQELDELFPDYCHITPPDPDEEDEINLTNVDRWLTQAGLLDEEHITRADTAVHFTKISNFRPKLTRKEFAHMLHSLAEEKEIPLEEIKAKLLAAGPPVFDNVEEPLQGAMAEAVERLATPASRITDIQKQEAEAKVEELKEAEVKVEKKKATAAKDEKKQAEKKVEEKKPTEAKGEKKKPTKAKGKKKKPTEAKVEEKKPWKKPTESEIEELPIEEKIELLEEGAAKVEDQPEIMF